MSKEGDLQTALMQRVEALTGFTLLWPRQGGDQPSGEHVRVYHLPNDTTQRFLGSTSPRERKGFLVLTLVSELGGHEAPLRDKAGGIADHFPIGLTLSSGLASVDVENTTVKPGRQSEGNWETPIWVEYFGHF